jgi:metal-responsive CopG/Arc/MetJ family transcriptional regulator
MSDTDLDATVLVRMSQAMLDRIDDYWHRRRLPSRLAGIREMLEQALDAAEKKARPK